MLYKCNRGGMGSIKGKRGEGLYMCHEVMRGGESGGREGIAWR